MALSAYDLTDLVRVGNHSGTNDDGTTRLPFRNTAGVDTDPTTVTLKLRKPDGTTKQFGWPSAGPDGTLTKEATGRFYFDSTVDQSGAWTWNLAGAGLVQVAVEGEFRVKPSAF